MTGWEELNDELNSWRDTGLEVHLWWRDDDAAQPCPELDRLVELSQSRQVPLGLAVIPGRAVPELAPYLEPITTIEVMQHGFAHYNHARTGEKKNEFPVTRPRKQQMADLMAGARIMSDFKTRVAVLVPPWNRFDSRLFPVLPGMGLRGISTYGAREGRNAAPALRQVNTHVDPINWRGDRGFLGEDQVLAQLINHLTARRQDVVDAGEPTGLLSHHLDHDAAVWDFIARLLDLTGEHSSVKWLGVGEAFGFK